MKKGKIISCIVCGSSRYIRPSVLKKRRNDFCGKECWSRYTRTTGVKDRFLKMIKINHKDCWEWQGFKNNDGYGTFYFKGRNEGSHRVAWILFKGEIPKENCVCHTCDNPSCVNPKHLWVGTHKENMNDRDNKGRTNRPLGETNGRCKLNFKTVQIIKDIGINFKKGSHKRGLLAKQYGICTDYLTEILKSKKRVIC